MARRYSQTLGEARYRELLDLAAAQAVTLALVLLDRDGKIAGWSAGAESLLRWSADEVLGADAAIIFTPEDRAAGAPADELLLARALGSCKDERWHLRKDGERFWAIGEMFALHENDEHTAYVKVIRDWSEMREARQLLDAAEAFAADARERLSSKRARLEAAEQRWHTLFDQMQEGFFVAEAVAGDPLDFRLIEVNPAFDQITGLAHAGSDGLTMREVLPGADELVALCRQVADDGAFAEREIRLQTGAGRWFKVRASRMESGRVAGMMLDVTAGREAGAALLEETQALETLNRSGVALASELDADRIIRIVTDAGVAMTGAEFGAFFYEARDGASITYAYCASGEEAAGRFASAAAASGSAPDGLAAPAGEVGSCMSLPILSRTGERLARLFFAHRRPGLLGQRAERLLAGLAGQTSVALDNARLFGAAQREIKRRQLVEEDLRELNETLEQRVEQAIAERDYAEDQLRQAQKMEAIGQLTGGIAHDFNNLLTVVSGNIDMVRRSLGAEAPPRLLRSIDNAIKGVERAAALTQRLLAFARRQPLQPVAVDVNRLVAGMTDLLRRSLSETIELEVDEAEGLWLVEVDPNQLENALLNLAVNASDAMADGGRLTVATRNERVEAGPRLPRGGVGPGDYVLVTVTDTGSGMSDEVLANAFDPFFTTKQVGKGTGLGLSQVYGFVKQSGGHVKIASELGAGTTVSIYLRRFLGEAAPAGQRPGPAVTTAASGELILVVEDDDDVRCYTVESLRELGYRVLEARDGATALDLLLTDAGVRLLLTDVVMPAMSGRELADRALALRPDLRVLFTTGYPRDGIVHGGRVDPGVALLPKPFTYPELAAKVSELLDR